MLSRSAIPAPRSSHTRQGRTRQCFPNAVCQHRAGGMRPQLGSTSPPGGAPCRAVPCRLRSCCNESRATTRDPNQTQRLTPYHSGCLLVSFLTGTIVRAGSGAGRSCGSDGRAPRAAPLLGRAVLQRAVPVGRRAAPQRPHRAVLLPLQDARSFALAQRLLKHTRSLCRPRHRRQPSPAPPLPSRPLSSPPRPQTQRYPRGGVALLLPGAAGGVVMSPAVAGGQLSVRVVVVEGVPQPSTVLPLPPIVLARPRRLRTERALRGKEPRGRGEPPAPAAPRSPASSQRRPCRPRCASLSGLSRQSPPRLQELPACPANGTGRHKTAVAAPFG